MNPDLYQYQFDTPLGPMLMVVLAGQLCLLDFADNRRRIHTLLAGRFGADQPRQAASDPGGVGEQIGRYFAGDLSAIADIPLSLSGSEFQQRAWGFLRQIPPGHTRSYGQQASALGDVGLARAVGVANAQNPVSIVVPCHRVIGANGQLTGYAGGIERKRWLLEHEQRHSLTAGASVSVEATEQGSLFG
jgi:methylated-DNA-[protein]-cysteine S-methyltransferase